MRGFRSPHTYIAVLSNTPDGSSGKEEIRFTAPGSLWGDDAERRAYTELFGAGYEEDLYVLQVIDITVGEDVYRRVNV